MQQQQIERLEGRTCIRYENETHKFIHEDFPYIYQNQIVVYSCIKAETASDVNNVNSSTVRSEVKATLCVCPWMHASTQVVCLLGVPTNAFQSFYFLRNFPNSNLRIRISVFEFRAVCLKVI